jgi:hypothetical protein
VNEIDIAGRKLALNLASLMAKVEYKYNRHEPCLVCHEKYMHHIDGLPCERDDKRKEIVKHNRWKKNNLST